MPSNETLREWDNDKIKSDTNIELGVKREFIKESDDSEMEHDDSEGDENMIADSEDVDDVDYEKISVKCKKYFIPPLFSKYRWKAIVNNIRWFESTRKLFPENIKTFVFGSDFWEKYIYNFSIYYSISGREAGFSDYVTVHGTNAIQYIIIDAPVMFMCKEHADFEKIGIIIETTRGHKINILDPEAPPGLTFGQP